uniref:Uncharacterized protein n=1 Tax=Anguilla anguilla TaxID=7936 RepID=A0A0E9QW14_ANGAN
MSIMHSASTCDLILQTPLKTYILVKNHKPGNPKTHEGLSCFSLLCSWKIGMIMWTKKELRWT